MVKGHETEKPSLTLQGFTPWRLSLALLSIVMIGVSIYLTDHYYEVQFPKTLVSGSMCDVSSFWNCDTATFSPLSSFMMVPTSVFGIIVGFIFFIGALFSRRDLETSNYMLAVINALGCLGLFTYSLVVLDGLCPGCTIYYLSSVLVCMLFLFRSQWTFQVFPKVWGVYGLLVLAVSFGFYFYTKGQDEKFASTTEKILEEFRGSADYEVFGVRSPYRIASATEKFEDAPLRVSLFSDFQCPVCKVFAEDILPKLVRHYKGKINFQYLFYPMDSSCNHNVSQPMHPMACEAAYVAACLDSKFAEVHDKIYEKQNELSFPMLQRMANEHQVSKCYNDSKTKQIVENMILDGDKLGIQATPTMIVNGKKLEGLLPLKFFILLFDDALTQAEAS